LVGNRHSKDFIFFAFGNEFEITKFEIFFSKMKQGYRSLVNVMSSSQMIDNKLRESTIGNNVRLVFPILLSGTAQICLINAEIGADNGKTYSGGDIEILQIGKEQGDDVANMVNLKEDG
nr:hypothetical protein [Tanacetum cinerariifolium]